MTVEIFQNLSPASCTDSIIPAGSFAVIADIIKEMDRPPIHHTGHPPVPIVQAPKRAVPSTQTEFFPGFTSHLILRYIHPQVSYQCFAALPISAVQATQTAAAKSAMPSVSHSQDSSYRIFMRSSSSVR